MFPFDPASLPQLTTRKALIAVDLHTDFLSKDGALPITQPPDFLSRTLDLAKAARSAGADVVWVKSHFERPRPIDEEQIVTTDAPVIVPPRRGPGRRRPPAATPAPSEPPGLDTLDISDDGPDPEAFLSHSKPTCLKPGSSGADLDPSVKDTVQKTDLALTKSHYSAFQDTHLLRMLRAKMVMEVFICGSLANVGVYATALDAARHGFTITVVEDCSGYRNASRRTLAWSNLAELTGCEIASAADVLKTLKPKPASKHSMPPRPSRPTKPSQPSASQAAVSTPASSSDLAQHMTKLRLDSESQKPFVESKDSGSHTETSGVSIEAQGLGDSTRQQKLAEQDGIEAEATNQADHKTKETTQKTQKTQTGGDSQDTKSTPSKKEQSSPSASPEEVAKFPADPKVDNKRAAESTASAKGSKSTEEQSMVGFDGKPPSSSQKGLCAGDTDVIENLLPPTLEQGVFDKLREEVQWQRMSHQGGEVPRLVAVQGDVADDGSKPVYRHPSDEAPPLLPFTPAVLAIKAETEKHLGHTLNHVLIQHYRDGTDYISEHSDKTLDIVKGSFIANVSLGAQRTMVLRTKRERKSQEPVLSDKHNPDDDKKEPKVKGNDCEGSTKRQVQRATLPHNSLCRMGLQTNMQWLHAIRQDKRADRDKTPVELAFGGGRISLTFRRIGTFLDADESVIWGQGATGKTRDAAHPVVNGQSDEMIRMLKAFGTENNSSLFDWDAHYGKGFDVLHMSSSPRFFASSDPVVNLRIATMLAEFGIAYAKGSMGPAVEAIGRSSKVKALETAVAVKYTDNNTARSVVSGELAIMLYLDARQAAKANSISEPTELAVRLTRFQEGLSLLNRWREIQQQDEIRPKDLKQELAIWEGLAQSLENGFLAGSSLSLPDFAVWPVLHDMVDRLGLDHVFDGCGHLRSYYLRVIESENIKNMLEKSGKAEPKAEQTSAVKEAEQATTQTDLGAAVKRDDGKTEDSGKRDVVEKSETGSRDKTAKGKDEPALAQEALKITGGNTESKGQGAGSQAETKRK